MDGKQFRIRGGAGGGGGRANRFKNAGFIALLVLFGLIVFAAFSQPSQLKEIPISQAISDANSGKTQSIVVKGNNLEITPKGNTKPTERSTKEDGSSLKEQGLQTDKVSVTIKSQSGGSGLWLTLAANVLPVILIAFILL